MMKKVFEINPWVFLPFLVVADLWIGYLGFSTYSYKGSFMFSNPTPEWLSLFAIFVSILGLVGLVLVIKKHLEQY